jgi:hypothetical protein
MMLLPVLQQHLVDITPAPVLPWLEGLDNRMVGRVEMLCGMLILRGIAAADMPAFQADTQVNPAISRLQTILTLLRARRDIVYMVKMHTLLCHYIVPSYFNKTG